MNYEITKVNQLQFHNTYRFLERHYHQARISRALRTARVLWKPYTCIEKAVADPFR